jgi:mitochondrial fission protein ELM1
MVALWIQQQSGGATRIVSVGKPSTSVNRFDLVIASSEVILPKFPHVMSVDLPLMAVDAAKTAAAAEAWTELGTLPRPLVAMLIGGPTNPYVYDKRLANRVIELSREVVDQGGTPYLSTSRRTPGPFIDQVQAALPKQGRLFRWSAQAKTNPYQALLGGADAFIVSADSISMQVEVARLGKPLAVLPVPISTWGTIDRYRRGAVGWILEHRPALGRALYQAKLVNQTRDYAAFHARLIEEGRAVWAGESFVAPPGPATPEVADAVERIKALAAVGAVS